MTIDPRDYLREPEGFQLPEGVTEGGLLLRILADPVGKPRMTQRRKYAHQSKGIAAYRAFQTQIALQTKDFMLPNVFHVVFFMPMPASWTPPKKDAFRWCEHQQKPDADNMAKGLIDTMMPGGDKEVFDFRASKFWADGGAVEIYYMKPLRLSLRVVTCKRCEHRFAFEDAIVEPSVIASLDLGEPNRSCPRCQHYI